MSTIVAISTPYGTGGIAVIRLSGPEAFAIADEVWKGKRLSKVESHTAHLGLILDKDSNPLDQSVATVFHNPNSFTGEDTVEFSTHGSKWIQQAVLNRLIEAGARPAGAGEFTRRAFLNRRLDLAQAEGLADLISASSRAAHRMAMSQVSGNFSNKIETLRSQLIDLASLLELELDFSEEDVEFADRKRLSELCNQILTLIKRLEATYEAGQAFKEGIPVTIAGSPNAGKSSLLNTLLREDKAIVSDIAGTTRDIIEDTREIGGILFRFYDTAGLHETADKVERIGIERAHNAISKSRITIWIIDATKPTQEIQQDIALLNVQFNSQSQRNNIIALNKSDIIKDNDKKTIIETFLKENHVDTPHIFISAKEGDNIALLEKELLRISTKEHNPDSELIITNARHKEALRQGAESLIRAKEGIESGITPDFISQDIRETLHHLGQLTGAITSDTLLTTVFSRFCIGK